MGLHPVTTHTYHSAWHIIGAQKCVLELLMLIIIHYKYQKQSHLVVNLEFSRCFPRAGSKIAPNTIYREHCCIDGNWYCGKLQTENLKLIMMCCFSVLNITNAWLFNLEQRKFDLQLFIAIIVTAALNISSTAATQGHALMFVVQLECSALLLSQQISCFVSCCKIYSDPMIPSRN